MHLAFTHPKHGQGPEADSVPRSYWSDPVSGAQAAQFHAVRGKTPAYVVYAVPTFHPGAATVESFDFEDENQPFAWTCEGQAVPFPRRKDPGYALGYDGSVPQAVEESASGLLGLNAKTQVGPRWPFFEEGYPAQVAANEMASYYNEGVQP